MNVLPSWFTCTLVKTPSVHQTLMFGLSLKGPLTSHGSSGSTGSGALAVAAGALEVAVEVLLVVGSPPGGGLELVVQAVVHASSKIATNCHWVGSSHGWRGLYDRTKLYPGGTRRLSPRPACLALLRFVRSNGILAV
jgi:hypothetical protein